MSIVKTVYDTDYVDAAHLAKAMENHRIIVIKAVCGMGKSTAIEQVVRGHNGPTMAVACKQTHAQDMAQQFSLEHYKTLDSEFPTNVCTTVHSLFKFHLWVTNCAKSGIVILDEIRSLLQNFNAPIIKNDSFINVLHRVMREARYVIAADADVLCDAMVLDFLTRFGDVALLEYTKPLVQRHLHVYTMEDRWIDKFCLALS